METCSAAVPEAPKPMVTRQQHTKKREALGDISNKEKPPTKVAKRATAAADAVVVCAPPPVPSAPPSPASTCAAEEVDAIVEDPLLDQADASTFSDYIVDHFSYLRSLEESVRASSTYMRTVQRDINSHMRAILVDWLVEVAEEYHLLPETLYISVSYIDRCLSLFEVVRGRLQLLGCACMLLASKYEEIYAPPVDEFVYISDNTYTREEILHMESMILNSLGFRLAVVTPKHFLKRFTTAAQSSEQEAHLVNYLAELTLQEYGFLEFKMSLIAAATVLCARLLLGHATPWTASMAKYTQYTVSELWPCVALLVRVHRQAPDSNLRAIREKYSASEHGKVSALPPLSDAALESCRVSVLGSVAAMAAATARVVAAGAGAGVSAGAGVPASGAGAVATTTGATGRGGAVAQQ